MNLKNNIIIITMEQIQFLLLIVVCVSIAYLFIRNKQRNPVDTGYDGYAITQENARVKEFEDISKEIATLNKKEKND